MMFQNSTFKSRLLVSLSDHHAKILYKETCQIFHFFIDIKTFNEQSSSNLMENPQSDLAPSILAPTLYLLPTLFQQTLKDNENQYQDLSGFALSQDSSIMLLEET